MTKRELAAFVLKLLGVYAIIRSLPLFMYISLMLATLGQENGEMARRFWMQVCMSVPFVLSAIAAVVLLTCNRGLSAVVVREDSDAKLSTSLSGNDIQAIGFSIVAVLVFLSAIPGLVKFIGSLYYVVSQPEGARSRFLRIAWQSGLSVALQLVLASVLFFRARGLANLWRRIQVGKYVKIEDVEQSAPHEP